MITKTLFALAYGIKQGTRATKWLLRDDIKQGKEMLKKVPYIKDYDIQSPIVKKGVNNDSGK
jgi:hypothetical protein